MQLKETGAAWRATAVRWSFITKQCASSPVTRAPRGPRKSSNLAEVQQSTVGPIRTGQNHGIRETPNDESSPHFKNFSILKSQVENPGGRRERLWIRKVGLPVSTTKETDVSPPTSKPITVGSVRRQEDDHGSTRNIMDGSDMMLDLSPLSIETSNETKSKDSPFMRTVRAQLLGLKSSNPNLVEKSSKGSFRFIQSEALNSTDRERLPNFLRTHASIPSLNSDNHRKGPIIASVLSKSPPKSLIRKHPAYSVSNEVGVHRTYGTLETRPPDHTRMSSTLISPPEYRNGNEDAASTLPGVPLNEVPLQRDKQGESPNALTVDCTIDGKSYAQDSFYNIPGQIIDHISRRPYLQPNHPICLTRSLIESAFSESKGFNNRLHSHPIVTVADNFDRLGFPSDHPGRSKTDTYYVNESHVLRTHTSAHEPVLFGELKDSLAYEPHGYTLCADVYRRDSIDRSHYPVFHQMEGARCWKLAGAAITEKNVDITHQRERNIKAIQQDLETLPLWKYRNNIALDASIAKDAALEIQAEDPNPNFDPKTNPLQSTHEAAEVELVARHLKLSIEFLMAKVFRQAQNAGIITSAEPPRVRWVPAYFPFTSPSWELEVLWQGDWLELLGCGVSKQQLLIESGIPDSIAWAWGIGVERLAMLLYGIPDIRLFWSKDSRFLNQFVAGKATKFVEFSKYPECYKDVAFWLPSTPSPAASTQQSTSTTVSPKEVATPSGAAAQAGGHISSETVEYPTFHENDLAEIVRDIAGSLAESVKLVDDFINKKDGRKSLCYRIMYRSLERTLTNEEVNETHDKIRKRLAKDLGVELR